MACDNGGCSLSCYGSVGSCSNCANGCSGGCSFCSTSCGDGCKGTCASTCSGCSGCSGCGSACSVGCTYSCSGGCYTTCRGSCDSTCVGSCVGTCSGSCTACTGSCSGGCDDGCKNGAVSSIYANISLKTILLANDIVDLKNLVNNETTRRGYTPQTVTVSSNTKVKTDTINAIITNLRTSGVSISNRANVSKADRSSMQNYINLAKDLYTRKLRP